MGLRAEADLLIRNSSELIVGGAGPHGVRGEAVLVSRRSVAPPRTGPVRLSTASVSNAAPTGARWVGVALVFALSLAVALAVAVTLNAGPQLVGDPPSIDVPAIGRFLRSRGTLFCLDAIQSLGVLPCSVEHCDFLVADAHKWLLGPQGIAILYVRREAQDRLRPVLQGWKSVRDPRDFQLLRQELAPTARRYEPGGLNVLGVIGLHAALALGRDVGGDAIGRRVTSVRTRLVRSIEARGHEVLGPREGPASIATFAPPPEEVDRILARLEARRVVVSVRRGARGERCIRVAPHFYASEAEVAAFLEALG